MASKIFNSKNLSKQIEKLLKQGKTDLVMQLLKSKELENLLPNIIKTLKKKSLKEDEFTQTKINTRTKLDDKFVEEISKALELGTGKPKIIIDEQMSPGIRIRSGARLIDATLETMLEKAIESIK